VDGGGDLHGITVVPGYLVGNGIFLRDSRSVLRPEAPGDCIPSAVHYCVCNAQATYRAIILPYIDPFISTGKWIAMIINARECTPANCRKMRVGPSRFELEIFAV
jgi:hypothetical protein